jgi:hypothetical protein
MGGGGDIFQCLVMHISRDEIYYVHARTRYILLSHDSYGLVTCVA